MAASEVTAHSIEPVITCDVRIAPAQTVCAWEPARQATEDGTREQVLQQDETSGQQTEQKEQKHRCVNL